MTAVETTTWRALNMALHDALTEDENVFLMGEDISSWGTGGGIYGVTRKLKDTFGEHRVRETPISEEVLISAAVGAAMVGTRPVLEIMYSDFTFLGFDGLINQAAKAHYMFGGQFSVPMTLRTNGGAGIGKAAQHSQSLETLFAHVPGLEVVVPSTPGDAYGLLRTAIASDNPTVFLEHKNLYYRKGAVERQSIPFGRADVGRRGRDVTVVATQQLLFAAHEAAALLSERYDIDIEIIDPRTLYPVDMETVYDSVRRTRHLVVAHEAPAQYGWGATFVSDVVMNAWEALDAAPQLIGGARAPIPYAASLESLAIPGAAAVVDAVRRVVGAERSVAV